MRRKARVSILILLLLIGGLAAAQPSAAQTVIPLGYHSQFFTDPYCPCHPDTIETYVVYGYYSSESGSYVESYRRYAGTTAYNCSYGFSPATFYGSTAWQQCMSYWGGDCPCAAILLGTQCSIQGPWYNYNPPCDPWSPQ